MAGPVSEHGMIEKYFSSMAASGGLQLLDDAALLKPSADHELVVTVDAIVSGVHFLPDDHPKDIAWKALAVNISDLAAKGAEPKGFVLTLGLEDQWQAQWLDDFAIGLKEASETLFCPLYGGDTVRSNGAAFLSITAFGEVPTGQMVQRKGARVGDYVCVTGTIGDAVLGLQLALGAMPDWEKHLDESQRHFLLERYHRPQPRLALSSAIRTYASAAMDVSDGLIGDLEKILSLNVVSADIDLNRLPLSAAVQSVLRHNVGCLKKIVTGGDDYEILCTISPVKFDDAVAAVTAAGGRLSALGTIVEPNVKTKYVFNHNDIVFEQKAFSHF